MEKKRIWKSFALMILLGVGCLLWTACNVAWNDNTDADPLTIWFDHPTTKWNEGLPIGNGSLGAMLYGTPEKEIITLNEETIWSGSKDYHADKKGGYKYISEVQQLIFDGAYDKAEKILTEKVLSERLPSGTMAYQMLGNLMIERTDMKEVTNFKTALDLNTATALTTFESQGVMYTREAFSSSPDKAIVVRYTANAKKAISLKASVKRTEATKVKIKKNRIEFSEHVGNGHGVKFYSIVSIEAPKGDIVLHEDNLEIIGADDVLLKIVAASDYRNEAPQELCEQYLSEIKPKSYKSLYKAHTDDYKSYFDRVSFALSDIEQDLIPTDERLKSIKANVEDKYLTQLQYQYGRYLLISSSRPGTLPANLQGIWVTGFKPPWNSDYHLNINLQMNYWPAEMTNLSECHEPFLKYIGDLREMGRITAQETYGCSGFVAHHTSDAWHMTRAFGKPNYGMWPMGAAWSCQHLYEHYNYTGDETYLRDYAYPVMKEAAEFFVDFMVRDPKTGLLVSGPSISPENKFSNNGKVSTINMGPTMDRAIIFELFSNCIASAEILGVDADFAKVLHEKMAQMPPLQIGSDGRLMEWTDEFDEPQPGHRHISHLYALHPSNQISKSKTPELFAAAKKTIDYRLAHGGGHTGWSRAWIINFWARLLDGEKAHDNIIALQKKSTLPNLLDLHPPFQIDGNFGVVSGITEMLMQSHDEYINILPALPQAWANGEIKGIVARGGFVIDIVWDQGQLKTLKVQSRLGNDLNVHYKDKQKKCPTQKGEVIIFDANLNRI